MQMKKLNVGGQCDFCGTSFKSLLKSKIKIDKSKDKCMCSFCTSIFENENIIEDHKISPLKIRGNLDQTIIGQEDAKTSLTYALFSHIQRIKNPNIPKSNVLIVGPSGTGKTAICERLCQNSNIPFLSFDATSFTTNGYTGDSIDVMFQRLIEVCEGNKILAEHAVIFIDEIDKKASNGRKSGPQVGTTDVQTALLKVFEGREFVVNYGKERIALDTSKMLFITAGAFTGMEYGSKTVKKVSLSGIQETKDKSLVDALLEYGMLSEFIGRFKIITETHSLTINDYIGIAKKSPFIKGQLGLLDGLDLKVYIREGFFKKVAEIAMNDPRGVRAMETFVAKLFSKIIFISNKEMALNNKGVTIGKRKISYEDFLKKY